MPIATAISVTQITSRRNSPPTPESFEVRSVCRRKSVAVTGGDFSVMMQPSIAIDGPTPRTNGSDVHALTNGHAVEMGPTTNGVANEEHKLIIGVDFGTTYSGVAAVYTAKPDEVDIIKSWPGGNGITSDKVPTELAYDLQAINGTSTPTSLTPEQQGSSPQPSNIRWGFQFRPEETRLRCIKLFLDRNQKLPTFVSPLETAAQLRRCNKTVLEAVQDYLTKLYQHTLETLTRSHGEAFMASVKIEVVLTVPAVWSDAAKNATLQAAERAGMGARHEIQMISEPEAAALYTLKSVQPNSVKLGDNFVVCDAGGGTVDLIAYKVTSLSPLRVEESAVGTGGLCGSAFLNYRFADHIKNRLGTERYAEMRNKKPKTWMLGVKYFEESVKRNFNEEDASEINIPFPGLADDEAVGIESGFLVMSADEVKAIFEPVIDDVIVLLEGQVGAISSKGGHVSGIILVGGFGQSNHLYSRLKKHFSSSPPPAYSKEPTANHNDRPTWKIEVMQPLYAWTAVVRGAVLRGVEGNMVMSRRSRFHYGTSYATVYDETKHNADEKYFSPLWERYMVSDRMQWHVAKGTPISQDTPISFHYTRNFRAGQSMLVEDELIACDADSAPAALSKDLVTVCTLKTDLTSVPKKLFTRLTTTKGVDFDNLDFELHMKIESANLVFELRIDGVKYGSVEAEFH